MTESPNAVKRREPNSTLIGNTGPPEKNLLELEECEKRTQQEAEEQKRDTEDIKALIQEQNQNARAYYCRHG